MFVSQSPSLPKIVFCGSFIEFSVLVAESLRIAFGDSLIGVVTTPPSLAGAGRKQFLKKTAVHEWAELQSIPVFTPEILDKQSSEVFISQIGKPDYLITAGYGKLLPKEWLHLPLKQSLNVHFSLLPAYRGANPAEWSLLYGEKKSGISLIEMDEKFDTGSVLAQAECPCNSTETRLSLYQKLYSLAAKMTPLWLNQHTTKALAPIPQPTLSPTPYATRLQREDGYITWQTVEAAETNKPADFKGSERLQQIFNDQDVSLQEFVYRSARALEVFPGLWTTIEINTQNNRVRILPHHALDNPQTFALGYKIAGTNAVLTFAELKSKLKK